MKKGGGNVYYTVTNPDGTKEQKICSIKDVYVLLNEKIDNLKDGTKVAMMTWLEESIRQSKFAIGIAVVSIIISATSLIITILER